jgi:hypothetical protein
MDDEAYARRVSAWFKEVLDTEGDTREEEDEDFAFYSGHQWKKSQRDALKAEKRPCLTLNYILPTINAVCGEERMNRQTIKIWGREQDDDAGAHAMTELIRWVMDECNGHYSLSRAFRSSVICGRGWVEVGMDYLDDPQGRITVNPVDRKEVYLDPLSVREDAADARFLIREKYLSEDEIEAMWPDAMAELELRKELSDTKDIRREKDTTGSDAYKTGDKIFNAADGTWQVLEAHHYEVVPGAIVMNPETGAIEELKLDEYSALEKENEAQAAIWDTEANNAMMTGNPPADPSTRPQPMTAIKRPIKCFYKGFVIGDVVLERSPSAPRRLKRFPYVPTFGLYDDEESCWMGLVRPVKDAQRQHNVEQSSMLHIVQTNPKSGWIAPKGSFVDRRKWETRSSQPGFIGEYNPSRGKPEKIEAPGIPRHLIDLSQSRLASIRDISGVNVDMMGAGGKQDAGVVMEMKRKQGMTVLQTLFDNQSLTRRVLGQVLIAYIQEFISDDRKVRVLGEQKGPIYVQASQDLQFRSYDAVVEDAVDTPTDKMATMHILQTTLPMLLKAGIPIPPTFIDLLPIAPHIRDEWKDMLRQQMQANQQPQDPNQPPQGQPPQ